MTNQSPEMNDEKRKMICLMIKLAVFTYVMAVVLFSISGCKQVIRDAPISHLYVIDVQHNVCAKRVITDKKRLSSKHIVDLPIEACDGHISLTADEFLQLREYMRRF